MRIRRLLDFSVPIWPGAGPEANRGYTHSTQGREGTM